MAMKRLEINNQCEFIFIFLTLIGGLFPTFPPLPPLDVLRFTVNMTVTRRQDQQEIRPADSLESRIQVMQGMHAFNR